MEGKKYACKKINRPYRIAGLCSSAISKHWSSNAPITQYFYMHIKCNPHKVQSFTGVMKADLARLKTKRTLLNYLGLVGSRI